MPFKLKTNANLFSWDWKIKADHTYSRVRGWCLSASRGPIRDGPFFVWCQMNWKIENTIKSWFVLQRFGYLRTVPWNPSYIVEVCFRGAQGGGQFGSPIDVRIHTEKFFPILIKSNQNQIVFTIVLTDLEPNGRPFAVPNQSENSKYNLISVWSNKYSKKFLFSSKLNCFRRQIIWKSVITTEIQFDLSRIRKYFSDWCQKSLLGQIEKQKKNKYQAQKKPSDV